MFQVLGAAWALLLGMLLLQIGNGLQGSLLGVRGEIEGFSTFELSVITSAYFIGFLGGSRMAPDFIRRVGHVRVFAALASFISAVMILYPTVTEPWAWTILRVIVGFCFSGVYVTAESWLNNSSDNANRGQALSLYMVAQMTGIVIGQGLLNVGDPGGYLLFIIPSVLVSISFAPILLSISPTPPFETAKPMSLLELYRFSPTGVVGMFLMGGIFSAQFGMSAVYASSIGMSVAQVSLFVGAIFMGALIFQFPVGWISDRVDRRRLILVLAIFGAIGGMIGIWFQTTETSLLAAFIVGGVSNPLYSLLIAYTNDYLEPDDMAAASGGMVFVNGLGAIAGPLITGWAMTQFGPEGFWVYIVGLLMILSAYVAYRMTQRVSQFGDEGDYDVVPYAPVMASASPVAFEVAQEVYIENASEVEENSD